MRHTVTNLLFSGNSSSFSSLESVITIKNMFTYEYQKTHVIIFILIEDFVFRLIKHLETDIVVEQCQLLCQWYAVLQIWTHILHISTF